LSSAMAATFLCPLTTTASATLFIFVDNCILIAPEQH
jgi:hypothetical protein